MSKYIDADKLTKAIEEKGLDCSFALKMERLDTLALIDELQQERPELSNEFEIAINRRLNLINGENLTATELLEETKGMAAELLDLARKVIEKEQPEVDLEKFTEKVKTFQARYKHPENISVKGAMAFMARMFYQYPNVARQWYESLPKVTQD